MAGYSNYALSSLSPVAAVLNGFCPLDEDITVKVRGGELTVRYTGDAVFLTGEVALVYEGEIEI